MSFLILHDCQAFNDKRWLQHPNNLISCHFVSFRLIHPLFKKLFVLLAKPMAGFILVGWNNYAPTLILSFSHKKATNQI